MAEFQITFARSAERELRRLDPLVAARILSAIERRKSASTWLPAPDRQPK